MPQSDFTQIRQALLADGYAAVWTKHQQVQLLESWAPECEWETFELDQDRCQLVARAVRNGALEIGRYQLIRGDAAIVDELRRAAGQDVAERPAPEQSRAPETPRPEADQTDSGWLFEPPSKIGAIGL